MVAPTKQSTIHKTNMSDTPPRPPSNRGGTRPSLMGIPSLSSRRLRSNSGNQQSLTDLDGLSQAEVNSIAPPSPVVIDFKG